MTERRTVIPNAPIVILNLIQDPAHNPPAQPEAKPWIPDPAGYDEGAVILPTIACQD
ncbi:MAG: hypothetical protein ACNA7E_04270 [Wenzhouxiangellaceae bacterium]